MFETHTKNRENQNQTIFVCDCSFFENVDRLARPDYVPTEADALTVRARTTGIVEVRFVVHFVFFLFIVVDVLIV